MQDLHLTESVFGTMRRPPQKPIRIGVCQEGLFKVDSTEDKVIVWCGIVIVFMTIIDNSWY